MNKGTALVTGASSGIGEATVRALLAKGQTVYAAARRRERMSFLQEAGARLIDLDLTDEASMVSAIDHICQKSGRIDVLVNNAGYGSYGALEDVPLDEARRQFEVNLFGTARLTQLVLPMMRTQHSGTIVNVSSVGGKIWEPFGAWYHATKYALEGLSDCLRMELKPFGIDVIVIEPGALGPSGAASPIGACRPCQAGPPMGPMPAATRSSSKTPAHPKRPHLQMSWPEPLPEPSTRGVLKRAMPSAAARAQLSSCAACSPTVGSTG